MLSNFVVALNSIRYKPTNHEFRIFFKKETSVFLIEDSAIPMNGFSFVPYNQILIEKKEDKYLVGMSLNLAKFKQLLLMLCSHINNYVFKKIFFQMS